MAGVCVLSMNSVLSNYITSLARAADDVEYLTVSHHALAGMPAHLVLFGNRALPCPDKVTFLNGGECGDDGNDGNGDNGPKHHRHSYEKQKTSQFAGHGMREAEAFVDNQGRNLIDDLDGDNYPCPDP